MESKDPRGEEGKQEVKPLRIAECGLGKVERGELTRPRPASPRQGVESQFLDDSRTVVADRQVGPTMESGKSFITGIRSARSTRAGTSQRDVPTIDAVLTVEMRKG